MKTPLLNTMSGEEKMSTTTTATTSSINDNETNTTTTTAGDATDAIVEKERSEKILKAKELYSQGSRNFLIKSYTEAADELSQVCALYEELYGELSTELGMPYLLYAKSLIALAVDENKVIDLPDEADEDDDDEEEDGDGDGDGKENGEGDEEEEEKASKTTTNGTKEHDTKVVSAEKASTEADSTADGSSGETNKAAMESIPEESITTTATKTIEEAQVSSSNDANVEKKSNGAAATSTAKPIADGEKPSTSNGDAVECADADTQEDDDENDAASNLQLAWEILELAAKIFSRQGLNGLSNLAEVQTELANIEFENNIMDAAREDYEKALKIYKDLPKNYHRAMAEIHYKIGLTYLMQQANKEGAASLKEACDLIGAEINDINSKEELTEKDKNNIQDMEETMQEIRAKIDEIEETQAQNIAEVRAALDSYIKPIVSQNANDAGPSSSSSSSSLSSSTSAVKGVSAAANAAGTTSSISSSSKPTDISHLIKRKKPEEPSSEAEASPAKRPAV